MVVGAQAAPAPATASLQLRLDSATRVAHRVGGGYWLVTAQGKVTPYGDARFYGSMAGRHLNAPIIGIVATPDGRGYWLVGKDGGVFSFGDARFQGSLGNKTIATPVVGMASSGGAPGGQRGAAGVQGPRGAPGMSGLTGPRGPIGFEGPKGPPGSTGPQGLTGGVGAAGATGAAGAIGRAGATGTTCITWARGESGLTRAKGATGATGAIGPAGATGVAGPTGATGPTGPAGAIDYAYVYNTLPELVSTETDVTLSDNGLMAGFSHVPGAPAIVALQTGVYLVNFSVSGIEPNQFTLFVNGLPVPGGTYGSGNGTQQNTGQVVVHLFAGDELTLWNYSSDSSVGLQLSAGGTQENVNASSSNRSAEQRPKDRAAHIAGLRGCLPSWR